MSGFRPRPSSCATYRSSAGVHRRMQNFRDVGGLATDGGGLVAYGVLYRSDAPLRTDDPPRCVSWPPSTVIDLRSPAEAPARHPLSGRRTVVYSAPLTREAGIGLLASRRTATPISLVELYRRILDGGAQQFARVARIVASSPGPTLIHCRAGKDRTGIVVAVLLDAIGVIRDQTVAETQENVQTVLVRLGSDSDSDSDSEALEHLRKGHPEILAAPGHVLGETLQAVDLAGGSAEWLTRNGLGDNNLTLLRDRLLGCRAGPAMIRNQPTKLYRSVTARSVT
jgi:protein-tyrosine phosphatase